MSMPSMQPSGEASERWRSLRSRFRVAGDDTGERLHYADEWERETDFVDRATLIRLQVRMAAIGVDHPEWFRLRTKAEEILLDREEALIPGWFRELGVRNPVFFRGFVEGCVVPIQVLINPEERERLFGFAPLRHLTVVGLGPNHERELELLFRSTEFRNIISLAMDRQGLTDGSLRILATYRPTNLRWLSIRDNELEADSLQWLRDFPNLQYVDFSGHGPESEETVEYDQGIVLTRTPPALARDYPFLTGPMPNRYELWR